MNPNDRLIQALIQAVKAFLGAGLPILAISLSNEEFRQALDAVLGNGVLTQMAIDFGAAAIVGAIKFVGGPTYKVAGARGRAAAADANVEKPGFAAS